MANVPMKWAAPTVAYTNYLVGALNSLANNAIDSSGTAINNETNLCLYLDLELTLASLDLSGQSAPAVVIYLIESIDGGNDFDTVTDAVTTDASMPAVDKICAQIGLRPGVGAEAKLAVKSMIPIPPGQFKLCLRNKTGIAFGVAGNSLAYRTYNLKAVTA
ncbi:hypothetical protein LCGC14_1239170 [marine sediment metagenome]|uniref:Uncharacterized protein n=1 Tax=marine sediment metagenome TaxID=412755 RepID=A0A0F9L6K1_9ZZZZ